MEVIPTPRALDNRRARLTHTVRENTPNAPRELYGAICGASVDLEAGTRRVAKACPYCPRQTYISTPAGHPITALRTCDTVPCHTCGRTSRTCDPSRKLDRSMKHAELANQASANPNLTEETA